MLTWRRSRKFIVWTHFFQSWKSIKPLFSVKMLRELNFLLKKLHKWDTAAFSFIQRCNKMIEAEFIMILRMGKHVVLFALTFLPEVLIFYQLMLSLISTSLVLLKLICTELVDLVDSVTLVWLSTLSLTMTKRIFLKLRMS